MCHSVCKSSITLFPKRILLPLVLTFVSFCEIAEIPNYWIWNDLFLKSENSLMLVSDRDHREESWQLPLSGRNSSPQIVHFHGLLLLSLWDHLDSHPSKTTVNYHLLEPFSPQGLGMCLFNFTCCCLPNQEALSLAVPFSSKGIFPETRGPLQKPWWGNTGPLLFQVWETFACHDVYLLPIAWFKKQVQIFQ